MDKQWHYTRGGNKSGPVSAVQLKRLATSGEFSPTDMVWTEGMAAWAPAGSMKGLFSSITPIAHGTPPPLPTNPPNQSATAGIGACAFCCKPMPLEAVKCSSCQSWRRDIDLLINKYRNLMRAQLAAILMGGAWIIVLVAVAAKEGKPILSADTVTIFLFTVVAIVLAGVPAISIRRSIQQVTKGLWDRPW